MARNPGQSQVQEYDPWQRVCLTVGEFPDAGQIVYGLFAIGNDLQRNFDRRALHCQAEPALLAVQP